MYGYVVCPLRKPLAGGKWSLKSSLYLLGGSWLGLRMSSTDLFLIFIYLFTYETGLTL